MDNLETLAPPIAVGWQVAGASVTGSGHRALGLPCQDAHTARTAEGPGGGLHLILVVSDGAGSARHAEAGSRAACTFTAERLAELLIERDLAELDAHRLLADLRAHLDTLADELEATPRDLACTLLVAVVGPGAAWFLQVGDGGMVFGVPLSDGEELALAFWPDGGEYANETYFVTDAPPEHIHSRTVEAPIGRLALFSDGLQGLCLRYAERAPHPPFFEAFFGALERTADLGAFEAELGQTLAQPRIQARTDDDLTLLLALHR